MHREPARLDRSLAKQGVIVGASGGGRIRAATRAELAEAAAEVFDHRRHEGRVDVLRGNAPFSLSQFAHELSTRTGQDIVWRNLPDARYLQFLRERRYPEDAAQHWTGVARAIAVGELLNG